jgi:hypothetical protein
MLRATLVRRREMASGYLRRAAQTALELDRPDRCVLAAELLRSLWPDDCDYYAVLANLSEPQRESLRQHLSDWQEELQDE